MDAPFLNEIAGPHDISLSVDEGGLGRADVLLDVACQLAGRHLLLVLCITGYLAAYVDVQSAPSRVPRLGAVSQILMISFASLMAHLLSGGLGRSTRQAQGDGHEQEAAIHKVCPHCGGQGRDGEHKDDDRRGKKD